MSLDPAIHLSQTVASLLTTACHLVMRFSLCESYPYKIWTLSKVYNPVTYRACVLEFLEEPTGHLDDSFSFALQQEALDKGNVAQAVQFLLGDDVQQELDIIIRRSLLTTLDIERKHFLDKAPERAHSKIRSLNRSSRNSILRRYRQQRSNIIFRKIRDMKYFTKQKYMNLRALAIEKNPHLFPRAAGQLHWQEGMTQAQRKVIIHEGDKAALDAFIEENKESLRLEAKQRRNDAGAVLAGGSGEHIPQTNGEWLQWIDSHTDQFHDFLRTSTESRRILSQRLFVPNSQMPAAPRLQPEEGNILPICLAPLRSCAPGFYCLEFGPTLAERVVCFTASIGRKVWGLALAQDHGRTFSFDFISPLHEQMQPMEKLLGNLGFDVYKGPVPIYSLNMEVVTIQGGEICLYVSEATPVNLEKAIRKESKHDSSESDSVEAAFEANLYDVDSESSDEWVGGSSSAEAGIETDVETSSASSSEDAQPPQEEQPPQAAIEKAAPDIFVIINNPYFSISNYADSCAAHAAVSLRARLSEKWCSPDLLGSKNKSKTIQIRDFDSDPSDPQIAQMVLSAWMLHRVQMNGFIGKNKSRKIWLDSEMKNHEVQGC